MKLPKPCIVHVERDHFVALVAADKKGVTYLCTDCGQWPGGRVKVSWEQWRAMTPGVHLCVARTGSQEAKLFQALQENHEPHSKGLQVASSGLVGGSLGGVSSLRFQLQGLVVGCGVDLDLLGPKLGPEPAYHGDPVDLSTGEEDYSTAPDITVYNPNGPAVSWGRSYRSLAGKKIYNNETDFGYGWSHSYNICIWEHSVEYTHGDSGIGSIGIAPGTWEYFKPTGNDMPDNGWEWQIIGPGAQTVASSASSNGWQAKFQAPPGYTSAGQPYDTNAFHLNITVPLSAPEGNYSVRVYVSGANSYLIQSAPQFIGTNQSGDFIVTRTPRSPIATPSGSFASHIAFPDGKTVSFRVPAIPTQSSPVVVCDVEHGYGIRVERHYDPSNVTGRFKVIFANQIVWETGNGDPLAEYSLKKAYQTWSLRYPLTRITNRTGQSIDFEYTPFGGYYNNYPYVSIIHRKLERIKDSITGTTLLSLGRDSSGFINSVSDYYGRIVYYTVAGLPTEGVAPSYPQLRYGLTYVSHIVATGTSVSNAPVRAQFEYVLVQYGFGPNNTPIKYPYLGSVTAQRQVGNDILPVVVSSFEYTAASQHVIGTTDAYGTVSHIYKVDADGGQEGALDHMQVYMKNSSGNGLYGYRVGHSSARNLTRRVVGLEENEDGELVGGIETENRAFGNTDNPYGPTQFTDGNGRSSHFSYDQWGRVLEAFSPRGTSITSTYEMSNDFPYNRLLSVQEGNKTPTTYEYYEPSGLIQKVSAPTPDGGIGDTTFTYDALGNVLSVSVPGNTSVAVRTTTFNYTQDGTYVQTAKVDQPLVVTDPDGGTTHYRYDALGRVIWRKEVDGAETELQYNVAEQLLVVKSIPTGQTGTGHTRVDHNYPFPGGPLLSKRTFNESGVLSSEIFFEYGLRNELLR
ncbi:MAG: RHS repeat protein, partial [Cytophagaceae bacterium]